MQYERATIMPAADVESAYFEPLMQWRSSVNTTAGSPFHGAFAETLAVAGISSRCLLHLCLSTPAYPGSCTYPDSCTQTLPSPPLPPHPSLPPPPPPLICHAPPTLLLSSSITSLAKLCMTDTLSSDLQSDILADCSLPDIDSCHGQCSPEHTSASSTYAPSHAQHTVY